MKTLKQLREEAYLKADLKHDSASIPTALANVFVNEAWAELYDLIIAMDDGRIFATHATTPTEIGEHSFLLPSDFYHLCSCHVLVNGQYIPAQPADPAEYAELADDVFPIVRPKYFLRENPSTDEEYLFIFPKDVKPGEVTVTYFPEPPTLQQDSDALSNKGQRLEFVTLGAAMRMLAKVERDVTALKDMQSETRQRIQTAITNRDLNHPRTIRDLNSRYGEWTGYWR